MVQFGWFIKLPLVWHPAHARVWQEFLMAGWGRRGCVGLQVQVNQMPGWSVWDTGWVCVKWGWITPIGTPLSSSPAIGTIFFELIVPPWEMGLMPCSHFLVGEYTWGQALPVDGELFEGWGQSAVGMWAHLHLCFYNLLIQLTALPVAGRDSLFHGILLPFNLSYVVDEPEPT